MSTPLNEFLSNLIQNSTDYYTVRHSNDTDLYHVFRMLSSEFASGSTALETVRNNSYVVLCEEDALFDNFGTFFNAPQSDNQFAYEDRYITWTSGSSKAISPAVYEDISTQVPYSEWEALGTWPYYAGTLPALTHVTFGHTLREVVYWSGSLHCSCRVGYDPLIIQGNLCFGNTSTLVEFSPDPSRLGGLTRRGPQWGLRLNDDPFYIGVYSTFYLDTFNTHLEWTIPFGLHTPLGASGTEFAANYITTLDYPSSVSVDGTYAPRYRAKLLHTHITPTSTIHSSVLLYPQEPTGTNLTMDAFTNDPGGEVISTTKSAKLNNCYYFGFAGIERQVAEQFNVARQEANDAVKVDTDKFVIGAGDKWDWLGNGVWSDTPPYPLFPKYTVDTNRAYPFLFEYNEDTQVAREVGLAGIISSGSNGSPLSIDGWITGTPHPGWYVNTIGTFGNRVYLDYSSGSWASGGSHDEYKHYLASYDGVSFSGSLFGNTARLNAPSGSVNDLVEFDNSFYALVRSTPLHSRHYIAKATQGLPNLSTTEGNWKFNRDLSDDSGNGHTLTGVLLKDSDYVNGMTELGRTSIRMSDPTISKGAILPAASATAFDMATGNFSIEAVVKIDTRYLTYHYNIFQNWGSNTGYRLTCHYDADPTKTGTLKFTIGDGTNTGSWTGTTKINDSKWHYIVLTLDNSANLIKGYVDGNLEFNWSTASITGNISPTAADMHFGCVFDATLNQLIGNIDQVVISKEVISAADVTARNKFIWNGDFTWNDLYSIQLPLNRFFITDDILLVTGGDRNVRRWDEPTNTLVIHETAPDQRSDYNSHYSILPDPSGGYYMQSDNHFKHTDSFFKTDTYRYVYPPSVSSFETASPTTIPAYRKQLDFLMDAAVAGSTREGAIKAVNAYTLVNPNISEVATLPGWKLTTYSGSIEQLGPRTWQIGDTAQGSSKLFRPESFAGAYLDVFSGSTLPGKINAGYLVSANTQDGTLTVEPMRDRYLDFNLRRTQI